MKRFLQILGEINYVCLDDNTSAIDLRIELSDVQELILNLLLLDYQRATSLILQESTNHKKILSFSVGAENRSLIQITGNEFHINLSHNALETIVAFLLTIYRDGLASVNHIDVELEGSPASDHSYSFLVSTDKFSKPMSSEEAKRLLGLE